VTTSTNPLAAFQQFVAQQKDPYGLDRIRAGLASKGMKEWSEPSVQKYIEAQKALGSVGATCQQELLREAGELWLSLTRSRVQTTEEFCDTALEDEFEAFDSRFHDCSPSVQECLEAHLERYQAFFVSVTCTRHLHR